MFTFDLSRKVVREHQTPAEFEAQIEAGGHVGFHAHEESLSLLSSGRLVDIFNAIYKELDGGKTTVNRFATKGDGARRVGMALQRLLEHREARLGPPVAEASRLQAATEASAEDEPSPEASEETSVEALPEADPQPVQKPKRRASAAPKSSAINFLGMRADIAPSTEPQLELKQSTSIRAEALPMLLQGATYEQLIELFERRSGNRKPGSPRTSKTRIYEMIRILCYHYGYGTQSLENGAVIKLITTRAAK